MSFTNFFIKIVTAFITICALWIVDFNSANAQSSGLPQNPQPNRQKNFNVKTYDTKMQYRKAFAFFAEGAYLQSLVELDKIIFSSNDQEQGILQYWRGRCLSHLHRFEEAASALATAESIGVEFEDVHYLLGQALYAQQDLKNARNSFEKSLYINYKKNVSLYYIGYISQLLGE